MKSNEANETLVKSYSESSFEDRRRQDQEDRRVEERCVCGGQRSWHYLDIGQCYSIQTPEQRACKRFVLATDRRSFPNVT